MAEHREERRGERAVPLSEAAAVLGISKDAVRMRVKRGTLDAEKRDDRVYVFLHAEQHGDRNAVRDEPYRELVEELRDRVRSLEEANRENRRIIAGLVQRVPELEASREAPGAPETVEEGPEGAEPRSATPGPQTGAQRPWWRRVFGG